MVKLAGKKEIYCAVLISGRGTNLRSIFKFSKKKYSRLKIKLVVSDRSTAKGLIFAKKQKINTKIINYENKINAEKKIILHLKKNKIDLICLAGFMKILSKNFIKNFKNKIINIHPSLLPKYKGLNTHQRAIESQEKYSGCTVHFVNERLDSGKIILQQKVKVLKSDNPNSLSMRILKVENKLYPRAINKILTRI